MSMRTTWLCSSTTLGTRWSSEYNFGANVSLNCLQVSDSHAVALSRFLNTSPGCLSALMTRSRIDERISWGSDKIGKWDWFAFNSTVVAMVV